MATAILCGRGIGLSWLPIKYSPQNKLSNAQFLDKCYAVANKALHNAAQ